MSPQSDSAWTNVAHIVGYEFKTFDSRKVHGYKMKRYTKMSNMMRISFYDRYIRDRHLF